MSYLVFARKYRPQNFDDVVGQEHVTRTLSNAIAQERVPHALIFTGPRGTGKTTIARILAKGMNCQKGPTSQPCNICRSCTEITNGHAADVFEIDGASNNSVDQVRELRENLKYMPSHSRYKIYIIDEVHMLSTSAFNALLKTLEEPPAHVLFVFATTEPQKIPVTILSRCQRHDLRRIELTDIISNMHWICTQEQIGIDDQSLGLIARESGGSMRDALSLLDHVIACTHDKITIQVVSELLGLVERRHIFEVSAAIFSRDLHGVLKLIDGIWRAGYEIIRFFNDLITHFHQLIVVKVEDRGTRRLDLPENEIEMMETQVAGVSETYLLQILELLFEVEPMIKLSGQPRVALEMAFIKMFQIPPALPIEKLIDHLSYLRDNNEGLIPAPPAVTPPLAPTKEIAAVPVPADPAPASGIDNHIAAPREESPRTVEQRVDPSVINKAGGLNGPAASKEAASKEMSVPKVSTALNEANASNDAKASKWDGQTLWDEIEDIVAEERPSLAGFLAKTRFVSFENDVMAIDVEGNEFIFKSIQKHLAFIEQACTKLYSGPVKVNLSVNIQDASEKEKKKKETEQLKSKTLSHPIVGQAVELFDGKVIDVKIT